jgi:hypothetical protein
VFLVSFHAFVKDVIGLAFLGHDDRDKDQREDGHHSQRVGGGVIEDRETGK